VKIFVSRLKKILPVREVYLFGSIVRGEIHENSDIDILIIGDFKERIFERIGKILDLTELPIEPLVYTPEEIYCMKQSNNPFIEEIMQKAIRIDI